MSVFKQGTLHILSRSFAREQKSYLKNKLLKVLSICLRKKCTYHSRGGESV